MSKTCWIRVAAAVFSVALCVTTTWSADAPPAAPKVSSLTPIQDLVGQMENYLAKLEDTVKSDDNYKKNAKLVDKDANTLIVVALSLGMSDVANPYQAAAPELIKAARALAETKDYAAAKAAVEQVKKAAKSKGGSSAGMKWEVCASLPALMKQVPLVNSRLKRNLKQFQNNSKENAGDSAVLAVIAQSSIVDLSETKKPGKTPADVQKWYVFCANMREAAVAVNKAVHAGDSAAAGRSMKTLKKSCRDCHLVFCPEAEDE